MSKLLKKSSFAVGVTLLPAFAFAQNQDGVFGILDTIQSLMNTLVPIIMALALLYFLWGLAQYIAGSGDEEKRKAGRDMMIYGIIALFVMSAVWGLVEIVGNTFDINSGGGAVDLPEVPGLRR